MKSNIRTQVRVNINAPVSKVWQALIDPEIIKQYFFGTRTTTDWKPGSPIAFDGEWQGKEYHDKGTIMEMVPEKLIRYNYWSSMSGTEDKAENYVVITYELSGENNNVDVTITQENIPDEKMKEHSTDNWKKVLNDLKNVVEDKAVSFV